MTKEQWLERDQELADAVKKAALELLAHQNAPIAQMNIPLGDDLWVTIGKREDLSVNNDV